jgi:hypothetical protein
VTPVETVEVTTGTAGVAAFAILFDVAAEADTYLSASSTSYSFAIRGPEVKAFVSGLMSTATKSGNDFLIRKGETERFTLIIAADFGKTGTYGATLNTLSYASKPAGMTTTYRIPRAGSHFSTDNLFVAVGPLEEISGTIVVDDMMLRGVVEGAAAVDIRIDDASGDRVYGANGVVVEDETWSHEIGAILPAATYMVSLYEHESGRVLATSSLTVR